MARIISLIKGRESIFTILSTLWHGHQHGRVRAASVANSCLLQGFQPPGRPWFSLPLPHWGWKEITGGGGKTETETDMMCAQGPMNRTIHVSSGHWSVWTCCHHLKRTFPPFLLALTWNGQGLLAGADNARRGHHSRSPDTLELDGARFPHPSLF